MLVKGVMIFKLMRHRHTVMHGEDVIFNKLIPEHIYWHYVSILKLQRCNRWSLIIEKQSHPTLCDICDYLSVLRLNLILVCKMDSRYGMASATFSSVSIGHVVAVSLAIDHTKCDFFWNCNFSWLDCMFDNGHLDHATWRHCYLL